MIKKLKLLVLISLLCLNAFTQNKKELKLIIEKMKHDSIMIHSNISGLKQKIDSIRTKNLEQEKIINYQICELDNLRSGCLYCSCIEEDNETKIARIDAVIFHVVEENPEFIGGMEKMYEYLNKNIIYPEMAKENGIQGKVFVQFVVWKDGTIRDINVVKGVHPTLDKEAVRVVKSMPNWKPGKQRGKDVNSRFTLPVKFRIPSDK